ncbi:hypothetical protein [Flavobacterium sp.]|uniref:hypothetical protein n=1 Tax=Flavobacterium sp. TaxID=239 RepID=UPI00248A685B|nr:hypothetical protein [Flavobacterium sp.]MDI1316567.1 hypothetical protein [Flavobacterium sp.]
MKKNYSIKKYLNTSHTIFLKTENLFKKIGLLLLLVFAPFESFGQTTLISPIGDGGFESGTTFSSNNWSNTLGIATQNQWVLNTGATAGFSGTRCAYISQNTSNTPPPYTYDIGTTRATHFYRNITIPAGETDITLSFNWLGQGESTFDRMRVWVVPTTYTPLYGTEITTTGTAPTGRIQVGATNYSAQATWTSTSFKLPIAYAGTTVRLVFEWRNDGSLGTQPPTAIDNISLISKILTAPANDLCANATPLPCGTANLAGTTVATTNIANVSGCPMSNYGVWYTFVGNGQQTTISTNPAFDIKLSVSTGTCGALTNIGCTDAAPETATFTTVNGTTYYVYVAHWSSGSATTGTFTISRSCTAAPVPPVPPVPPVNDLCANATNLPCGTTNLAGTTVNTTNIANVSGCSMSNYGVWYTFVGNGQQTTITTNPAFDIKLSVSTGTCGSLTNIVCTDTAPETATFTTVNGTTYYVYVAYWLTFGTTTGTFTISRSCTAPPPSPCISITNIATCGTALNKTIVSGNGVYSPSACGWTTPGLEVIYSFTPAATGVYSINQTSSYTTIDYQFMAASTGCGPTGWTCIDDLFGSSISAGFTLTAGIQYYILLDPESSVGGNVSFMISCPLPPLTNDECAGAISLPVNSLCSYSTYTNTGATPSIGMTAPACGNYSGGDVWFSVVVPATGEITVDLQGGGITDSGMAFYSGTCGSLTLLECNDDDPIIFSLMSNINLTGLTPGQIIYVRVWGYGGSSGTFGICASTPSCPSPSDLYTNILSATSVTVGWTASVAASGGYQYFINTTGTAPTAGTTPTGSTSAGVTTVTLLGLTPGLKYYFWVRSYCGGSDVSSWFGPTNYTPCAVGSGTGTTALACITPVAAGQGLSGVDPAALLCSGSTCTNLEVTYLPIKQTTDYAVSSIPYAPPYQFTCLQNPVSVNIDDVWSSTINLPFNFCFYGNNYNKCLMGSNGVITFDTTTNSPGGYSTWSFSNNLPNNTLFKNTIFGVYHDIDPSKGGQVGWELITLNSGCRALVASWNEIPMFSAACNSSYYTGMMVLYENTNIIEVYIKEKNICATWNDGNAIIGVQNTTGTAAVVAPSRNGLDTNWTVANGTGEAWRFTPNGPSVNPTVQWYQGTVATGTPIAAPAGTADVINVCPSATTTYTAEVTYPLCTGNLKVSDITVVTITGNKVWNGNTNNNWNIGTNWTPNGVPTNADCVIVPVVNSPRPYPIISNTPNAVGYNLAVYNNASLTINSNQNLTITDKVTVQPAGIFTINNSASLIQINNILNSGNIIYKRDSPNIRMLDYSYWSSPVVGFNVSNIVSPLTFGPIYRWNTTIANGNGGQGTWQNAPGSIMVAGKGYIARAPNAAPYNSGSGTLSGTFTGVPQNGIITIPIERGNDQNTTTHYGTNGIEISYLSDNWNLLGNPYPSAIRGSQFLFDNRTKILGNIRLWTHGTLPSNLIANPFYSSFVYNYTAGDYYTFNFTGTSCCPAAAADLYVGSGQGFFVQMIDGPAVSAADNITVEFNNGLRNASLSNSSFYRTSNVTTTSAIDITNIERNRIWLDFINPNGQSDRTLFGYIENATMGVDNFYDCITQNTGGTLLFSEIGDTKFNIQGRSLPFDVNDEVPLGINAPTQGDYTIGIAAVDGLFNNQNIYLKDNLLNITHDLKVSPYHFNTTQSGGISNRFKVVYVNNTLGVPTNTFDENTIKVLVNNEVAVSSNNFEMETIEVFNLLGQKLDMYTTINSNYIILSNLRKNNTTLLLKIKLQTGGTVTRKIIY